MYSSLIHKHSCVFYVKHKNLSLLASYFRSYLIFEKNICITIRISSQHQCVTSVTMPGKLIILPVFIGDNLSSQGNFSISQGKLDSFKEVRGR